MQEVVEVVKISKNPDNNIICKRRKMILWADVESVEEAHIEILEELNITYACEIILPYEIIVIQEKYTTFSNAWQGYLKYANEIGTFIKRN